MDEFCDPLPASDLITHYPHTLFTLSRVHSLARPVDLVTRKLALFRLETMA